MKGMLSVTVMMLVLCSVSPNVGQAQEGNTLYVTLGYVQVPPGGESEYVAMEQEIWKPIHAERVKRGLITAWNVYDVWYTAMDTPYDYVVVNVYDDFAKIQSSWSDDIFTAAHPGKNLDPMMERTSAARDIIHSEVWELLDATEGGSPGEWLMVNYMTVPSGGGGAYMAMEREVWKPLHEVRVKKGELSSWGMYMLMMPSGTSMHYNYATVDTYDSFAAIGAPWSDDLVQMAHPGTSEAEQTAMMNRTAPARSVYKSELWHRLEGVAAE